ncbi:hypothetical protein PV327_010693 [Microctonus hyperodae]|uniref:Nuclear pore complex protein Nup88 n=1 Tax=Microctonus hyperodae TaxID=165561 RepID=A0AA39C8C2_MICHY|nr:hypothetical protein PV327_010693 [Microctonus hyperodae]
MQSCTDPLRLNDHDLFKELKCGLSKSEKDTRNILEIRDDILYVWNPENFCILTLNIASTRGKPAQSVPYQKLQPIDPPIFEITNLLINETATLLTLWGNLGVVLVELPRRWGKDNAFQGGKDLMCCVNYTLNECNSQLASAEIRRVRWHPGSSNDCHLLVLLSTNIFQLYDCELGNTPKLVKIWKIGPTPSLSPRKNIPTIESLGETGVDFDFVTPTIKVNYCHPENDNDNYNWDEIEWGILVLRGDGNVLIVHGNILQSNATKPSQVRTLSIHPPTVDNYGVDSCSIMCIPTTPPIVSIATATGIIHHAILLRDEQEEINDTNNKSNNKKQSYEDLNHTTNGDTLFVFESVEMELGLLFTDNDSKYKCPIHLHRDRENKSRYFCSHNAGIHMITLPIVSELTELLNYPDENLHLFSRNNFSSSSSQYLVCTRTKHTDKGNATPVLGFGLLQQPCPVLITLLHTGIVVDLSVVDLDYFPRVEPMQTTISPSKKMNREPFDNYIRSLLKQESTSQPITKLGIDTKLSGKEAFQLLDRATSVFRTCHFVKHERVRNEIGKKVRALKALKNHQLKELSMLMESKIELQDKAQDLAERYEDIKERQEKLAQRAEEVLRLVKYKELSSAERAEAAELEELNEKLHTLEIRLNQLKKKDVERSTRFEMNIRNENKPETVLSNRQHEIIENNLKQTSNDIAAMVAQVKTMERELSL